MSALDTAPAGSLAETHAQRGTRAVAFWLWSLAVLVFLMVVLGGATRLTESGLSITEWKPISGALPPLSAEAWQAEFENYKRIPQYAALFPDMDLAGFKFIFFFEWSHRLLGRLIGVATALPLLFFWLRGRLPEGYRLKLLGLLALGGLQGFVGWWMVKSGLSDRVEVAQERLAIHLILASLTFCFIVWLAASLRKRPREISPSKASGLAWGAGLILLAILVQIGLGALVAGLRAGRAYNTWPLIEGNFLPPVESLTLLTPLWRNFVDNLLTVQFQHRMVAYLVLGLTLLQVFWTSGTLGSGRATKRAIALLGLVLAQVILGILTLVLVVPLWAGLLHQAFAMLVLGMAVAHLQALSQGR
ncbi:COX15/CtaA family protein [Beijerinckia indica]|uniref:Heme A synthase n=1 Tax=Beijerinckia indica subsp. indica (strain ATCC 9039 / DSM 1715 / NCIMB 8712) TaxID=395963 RepID=CTAA_BEII9|nr:COX15/CtaA family protein [Beijerinckia indica]B2IH44.1 RecName: Full=Heme A synthase; Short=HAS; AltName: Full=Cytochrome aa3-controlling protein [Beijerinckia indica subsp. indica ATCC 9039]ACB94458.1 cytochrome oxidase assembly [Beijerinckia indica subsp. indica ATCC 9039]